MLSEPPQMHQIFSHLLVFARLFYLFSILVSFFVVLALLAYFRYYGLAASLESLSLGLWVELFHSHLVLSSLQNTTLPQLYA